MTRKTTIYLPDDLKVAIEQEAARRGVPEAQVIRDAIATAVSRPQPRPGIIHGEPFAERVDELMVDFGER
jgi:predicted transcriptional regulator